MKRIDRDLYLKKLVEKRENGLVKIVTGLRRCGKSFLLDPIYKEYLLNSGVRKNMSLNWIWMRGETINI